MGAPRWSDIGGNIPVACMIASVPVWVTKIVTSPAKIAPVLFKYFFVFVVMKNILASLDPSGYRNLMDIKTELIKRPTDYVQAKYQAQEIDRYLGYQCKDIENNLNRTNFPKEKELWIGLDLQSFQTPYSELVEISENLNPQDGETWLDLGAGYGRLGVVLGFLRPQVHFVGYEFVDERVQEASRIYAAWGLKNAKIKKADLVAEEITDADVYFIYDFGSRAEVFKVLEKLREKAKMKSITLVARGRGMKNWVYHDFPWFYANQEPRHFSHWSIFKS